MDGTHNRNILYEYCIETTFKSVVAFYLIECKIVPNIDTHLVCISWEARFLLLVHCTTGI